MYNVLDIAVYVINYENSRTHTISNLKLQKILYFIQALFLVTYHEPCFKEQIEAWDFGPVVPDVYHEFKKYGNRNIPVINRYFICNQGFWGAVEREYNEDRIYIEDRELIESVLIQFQDFSASELVEITHNQQPWIGAYKRWSNNVITKKAIREYFEED